MDNILDNDKTNYQIIEQHYDRIHQLPHNALTNVGATRLVEEDLRALAAIKDPETRFFAQAMMYDDAVDQNAYKNELIRQSPQMAIEVQAAGDEAHRRVAAKEERKSKDMDAFRNERLPALAEPLSTPEYRSAITKLSGNTSQAEIKAPSPNAEYVGKVIQYSDTHIVQQIGKHTAVAHDLKNLANAQELMQRASRNELQGKTYQFKYADRQGTGTISPVQPPKQITASLPASSSVPIAAPTQSVKLSR